MNIARDNMAGLDYKGSFGILYSPKWKIPKFELQLVINFIQNNIYVVTYRFKTDLPSKVFLHFLHSGMPIVSYFVFAVAGGGGHVPYSS